MKAVVYTRYGSPDVLELKEIEKPVPKDDEVLVKVYAVSINDWDYGLLLGVPFMNRIMSGLSKPAKKILGSDIAGKIEAVGMNVKKFRPGDEVFGDLSNRWGGFAEYVCAPENSLALKPSAMSFEQAAAIPQAGMLAVQGLIDKGHIKNGQKILINGAGGGVGTFGIQIARQFNTEVTGVDKTSKLELMCLTGFDNVIDYTKEDFTESRRKYDLILDVKTNRPIIRYLRSLNPNGTYITVGGSTFRLLQAFILGPVIGLIIKKHVRVVALKPNKDLKYLTGLFEAGKLKSVIDGPYKLDEIRNAFRLFAKGEHKGKIIITISHN